MRRFGILFALCGGLVACGGASAQQQRPLAAGETRPTKEECVAAVNNYEHTEYIQNPYPLQLREAIRSNDYQEQREHRLLSCSSDLSAREAECISRADTLVHADACAPHEHW